MKKATAPAPLLSPVLPHSLVTGNSKRTSSVYSRSISTWEVPASWDYKEDESMVAAEISCPFFRTLPTTTFDPNRVRKPLEAKLLHEDIGPRQYEPLLPDFVPESELSPSPERLSRVTEPASEPATGLERYGFPGTPPKTPLPLIPSTLPEVRELSHETSCSNFLASKSQSLNAAYHSFPSESDPVMSVVRGSRNSSISTLSHHQMLSSDEGKDSENGLEAIVRGRTRVRVGSGKSRERENIRRATHVSTASSRFTCDFEWEDQESVDGPFDLQAPFSPMLPEHEVDALANIKNEKRGSDLLPRPLRISKVPESKSNDVKRQHRRNASLWDRIKFPSLSSIKWRPPSNIDSMNRPPGKDSGRRGNQTARHESSTSGQILISYPSGVHGSDPISQPLNLSFDPPPRLVPKHEIDNPTYTHNIKATMVSKHMGRTNSLNIFKEKNKDKNKDNSKVFLTSVSKNHSSKPPVYLHPNATNLSSPDIRSTSARPAELCSAQVSRPSLDICRSISPTSRVSRSQQQDEYTSPSTSATFVPLSQYTSFQTPDEPSSPRSVISGISISKYPQLKNRVDMMSSNKSDTMLQHSNKNDRQDASTGTSHRTILPLSTATKALKSMHNPLSRPKSNQTSILGPNTKSYESNGNSKIYSRLNLTQTRRAGLTGDGTHAIPLVTAASSSLTDTRSRTSGSPRFALFPGPSLLGRAKEARRELQKDKRREELKRSIRILGPEEARSNGSGSGIVMVGLGPAPGLIGGDAASGGWL
jgi:hypothetical protein